VEPTRRFNGRPAALALVFCLMACHPAGSGLQMRMSEQGIASLQFGGWDFVSDGQFRVGHVDMRTPGGELVAADLHSSSKYNSSRGEIERTFPWGVITIRSKVNENRLDLTIETANRSPNSIEHVFYEALTLKFAAKPMEYDGNTPMLAVNMGDPTVIPLTAAPTQVVLTNEDVSQPLVAGFPWALDKPTNTIFPLRINTGKDNMYPDSLPEVHRPIPPGAKDTFHFSLIFRASARKGEIEELPVYRTFRSSFPARLHWKDRRPIGQLILGRSGTGWKTNPRGWFLDPNLDVTTPAGHAAFRTRLLEFADHSISYLQNLSAQGMVTWDIEGEQYAQPVSYVGDPRLLAYLAPEMVGVADEYFAKFRKAGFRVGVCLRPQTFVAATAGNNARQDPSLDPAQTLVNKIRFARDRWGATLFYVDSNGNPSYPLDVRVFQEVAKAFPEVLLIPEHSNTAYFSVTAPYAELRGGFNATPAPVLTLYHDAFSVINVTDGPLDEAYPKLEAAVRRGDTLLTRAWFADPAIDKVRTIYSYLP